MQVNKDFIISCKHFGGFKINVDINLFENKQEIIEHVLSMLKESLSQLSLECLISLLNIEHKNYHIHDFDFGHFFTDKGPFYICNHCNDFVIPTQSTTDVVSPVYNASSCVITSSVPNSQSDREDIVESNENINDKEKNNHEQQENSNPLNNFFMMYNNLLNNDYQTVDNVDDIDYNQDENKK